MEEKLRKLREKYPTIPTNFLLKVWRKYRNKSFEVLHDIIGPYELKRPKKILKLIEEKRDLDEENIYFILSSSLSTKERSSYYIRFYSILLEYAKKFEINKLKILDVGCGLNPVSFYFIKDFLSECTCVEINRKILEILERFFSKYMDIEYSILWGDFSDEEIFSRITREKYDIALFLKILPLLDRYFPEDLDKIPGINTKLFVFSFPRLSLSGKRLMGMAWNRWTERFSERYNLKILKKFQLGTEFFIILSKEF